MKNNPHLYQVFQPTNYQLFIDINRRTRRIVGRTIVSGTALQNQIALHQKYLDIKSIQLQQQDLDFQLDDSQALVHITLPQTGQIRLVIDYQAALTDSMMGIYPSYYQVEGVAKELIGTQFETTFARQAFPCVDEPEAKATFDIALKFDEHPGEIALSNMPEEKVVDGFHYFATTAKMSTYLVAFACGELQSKQTTTNSGVQVGVFSTKAHDPEKLDFALDIAKRSIEFYENFYQTPYPLPHSWQLALPDFSAGAMENWGLVTYREEALLVDPHNSTLDFKKYVATVIAHELAHQWFGDLVTMKWWDDLWLNESFANMMEYVAIDALEPDWKIWETFETDETPAALQRDATDGVQAVHVAVEDPAEIDALFDSAIVYAKGARLLVMVRALIGDEALRQGLKAYFQKHQYANATGADLWQALGAASQLDLAKIMQAWLEQPGYPVVNAQVIAGKLTLTQHQFFIGEHQAEQRLWPIPLNSNYSNVPTLMTTQELVVGDYQTLRQAAGQPFRLNVGNHSHFLVHYDDQLLNDLLQQLPQLDAISQRQLLQELRLLAQSQQISYAQLIPLLKSFANSPSAIVNQELYQITKALKIFIAPDTTVKANLENLLNQLSQQQVQRLGWQALDTDTDDDQLIRPIVLQAALEGKNTEAINAAHQVFLHYQAQVDHLPATIRPLVLSNEVKNYGSSQFLDDLLSLYQQATDAPYRSDICRALTSSLDPSFLQKLVSCFENSRIIKPQDLRRWFNLVLANPQGEQLAWDWIRQEWDWLEATVGGDMEFVTFITVIAQVFKTPQRLTEFQEFFEPKRHQAGLTREITMDYKVIAGRIDLIKQQQSAVMQALSDCTAH